MIVAVERRRGRERREDEGEVNERREGREVAKDGENNTNRRQNGCQERGRMTAEMRWRLNPPKICFFTLAERPLVLFLSKMSL